MKVYRITLKNHWGESFVVTVTASSLYEAMRKIELESDWHFSDSSVIGGTE